MTNLDPTSLIKTLKQTYNEKKKARESARRVDYYEKNYGFVPKNAMTEAEWKKARRDAPKVKGAGSGLKITAYQGHYWRIEKCTM
ncbi:hypothetical protein McaMca56_007023 [Microsporum canis]